jgi:hypothetical protein
LSKTEFDKAISERGKLEGEEPERPKSCARKFKEEILFSF